MVYFVSFFCYFGCKFRVIDMAWHPLVECNVLKAIAMILTGNNNSLQTLNDKDINFGSLPTALRKVMIERFPKFDQYQLAKYNKEKARLKKGKDTNKVGTLFSNIIRQYFAISIVDKMIQLSQALIVVGRARESQFSGILYLMLRQ